MSLAQEEPIARAYAKRFPKAEPYGQLPEAKRREIRAYFESRGVIVNHRFGVTGRIGAYSALRRFMLGEPITEQAEEEEPEEAEDEAEEPIAGKGFTLNAATELHIKRELEELQRDWPQATDKSSDADQTREHLLSSAQQILMPIATIAAQKAVGPYGHHFTREDAEDAAQDALVGWKAKVLRRIREIQQGAVTTQGNALPDEFVGDYADKKKRNLVADIQGFVRNYVRNASRKSKRREVITRPVPIASEHEHEGEEGQIGVEPPTHQTPASMITGAEQTADIMRMFRSIARQLARNPAYKRETTLLNTILDTKSSDRRFLMGKLGWSGKAYDRTRDILAQYLKRRSQTIPALKNFVRRILRESAETLRLLCEEYPVLHLLLDGLFLPAFKPCPMLAIYEKYEQLEEDGKVWALRTRPRVSRGGSGTVRGNFFEIVRVMEDGRELSTPMIFGRKFAALAKLEELKKSGDSVVE